MAWLVEHGLGVLDDKGCINFPRSMLAKDDPGCLSIDNLLDRRGVGARDG